MKKILGIIQIIASLLLIGASRIWAPVCDKKLELVSGKNVNMKCFYADKLGLVLAFLIIVVSILLLMSKVEFKKFYFLNLVLTCLLFLTFTNIIGVCMNPSMPCNKTALWGKIAAGVVAICSLFGLFSGKSDQLPS